MTPPGRQRDASRDPEILRTTLALLQEVGYDKLTMDAVAARARAGKATLYRRWASKADLVVDAMILWHEEAGPPDEPVDTGSLRGDLQALCCGSSKLSDPRTRSIFLGLLTALHRDEELATVFRARLVAARDAQLRGAFERAVARGEAHPGADVGLLATTIPGHVLFASLTGPTPADQAYVLRVIDNVVLPAALHGPAPACGGPAHDDTTPHEETHVHQ
ncbi:TetR/AcrR family transcriptional regulator [Vallicoccus soli]|uniref:TetR/AcrR family transcriptional regulator n=1 Tax=Vallicoccus soli TaxID=2339232 RepID=UPI001C499AF5|nr:TetR/AcrR family transcriptional regulator [Vallicoccus soli]